MAAAPAINGTNYSWADITLILFGVPVTGIAEISYSAKQEKTNNYGFGTEPVSRGVGNVEYDASITLYQDTWKQIIDAAPNRDPKQIAPFNIQVVFGSSRTQLRTDILQYCEFLVDSMDAKQGDSKLLVKVPLIIAGIKHGS
jgi:hypothetical protein